VEYKDKTLTCSECGQRFTFTGEDQSFYARKGYTEPKRCANCRAARRSERDFGFTRPRREMFDAVCASCGQATQVPFEPRGDRPVYCRDCFARVGADRRRD
jgi:CxxC-x17-CxxC domain-containing protein